MAKKLTDNDLVTMIDQHVFQSNTYANKINNERALAFKYFNSEPYGNEKKGRASYVSSEVLETISWALPMIMDVFEKNDDIVKFDPISPETLQDAELATDYCEYVLKKQNKGFLILRDFIFDALLQKNAFVKIYYDNTVEYLREEYEDLSDFEVDSLLNDPNVTPIDRETTLNQVPSIDPLTGQPTLVPQNSHKISIKRAKNNGQGRIKIENVPPEEVIVSRMARSLDLDECPFIAHKVQKSISWLRSQGYKIADDISDSESQNSQYSPERLVRQEMDGSWWTGTDETPLDPSQRMLWIVEAYMQVDYDGDGIAEWRKITKIGKTILDNEPFYYNPFVSICPIPIPHKFYGLSLADLVMDLQLLKSMVMRAQLDSFNFNINPAKAVNINAVVDVNDLLDTNPGNWIRLRGEANNNIFSLPNSGVGDAALNLINYIDNVSESRSGVSKYTQGIDTNAFNKTATGTQAIMNASQQKMELVTRLFAETGLAEIYKKILKVANLFVKTEQLIPIGQQFVSVDPRKWMNLETLTTNVGTGALDKQADIAQAQQILQIQTQLLQAGRPDLVAMVDANKIYNAGQSMLKAMGKKNIYDFFNDPQSQQYQIAMQQIHATQQPPPPDPTLQAAQVVAQQQAQAAQLKAQTELQKYHQEAMIKSAEFELRVRDDDRDYELAKMKMELDYQVNLLKLQHQYKQQELDAVSQGVDHAIDLANTHNAISESQMNAINNSGFNNTQS